MSQENVETVRALIELWNVGNRRVELFAEYCDPAIELESPLSSVVGEPYRGFAGIERWERDLDEQFAEWHIAIDDLRPVSDQVIGFVTVNARGRASDIALHFASASVAEFGSDHRITRIRIYPDANEALKAVGLAE